MVWKKEANQRGNSTESLRKRAKWLRYTESSQRWSWMRTRKVRWMIFQSQGIKYIPRVNRRYSQEAAKKKWENSQKLKVKTIIKMLEVMSDESPAACENRSRAPSTACTGNLPMGLWGGRSMTTTFVSWIGNWHPCLDHTLIYEVNKAIAIIPLPQPASWQCAPWNKYCSNIYMVNR